MSTFIYNYGPHCFRSNLSFSIPAASMYHTYNSITHHGSATMVQAERHDSAQHDVKTGNLFKIPLVLD